MTERQPRHTKLDKQIITSLGEIILESAASYPRSESNLYCVSGSDKVVWFAELPEPGAHYTRMKLDDQGEKLITYSTRGHACEIDLKTGKLLSKILMQ
jgi:hypothetical protein